jgi:hypothetical protein
MHRTFIKTANLIYQQDRKNNTTVRGSNDSSVGIATSYGLDGPGIESR